MCEILHPDGSIHNSTSTTSDWSQGSDSSTDCSEKRPSTSEEPSIENYGLKGAREYPESSRARFHYRRHHHHHSKSLKKKDSVFLSNMDRYHRTAAVLRCSGLLQISQSISELLRNNETIQTEIDKLRQITKEHSIQLQRQMEKKLQKESETSGVYNEEGQKLLDKLSQSLL